MQSHTCPCILYLVLLMGKTCSCLSVYVLYHLVSLSLVKWYNVSIVNLSNTVCIHIYIFVCICIYIYTQSYLQHLTVSQFLEIGNESFNTEGLYLSIYLCPSIYNICTYMQCIVQIDKFKEKILKKKKYRWQLDMAQSGHKDVTIVTRH